MSSEDELSAGHRGKRIIVSFPPATFALIACFMLGISGVFHRALRREWPSKPMLLGLGLVTTAVFVDQFWLTLLALLFFGAVIALPVLFSVYAIRCLQCGELNLAARWSWLRGLVDSRWSALRHLWSLAHLHVNGQPRPAESALADWTARGDPDAMQRRDGLCVLIGDWDRLRYSNILEYRIRGLCELGYVAEAALEFAAVWQGHSGIRRSVALRRAALPLLAFTGRSDATQKLLAVMRVPQPTAEYWHLTSRLAAEDDVDAKGIPPVGELLNLRWRQRLENPPRMVVLESSSSTILDEVVEEIECAYRLRVGWFWRYPVVTTILALCLCGFILQSLRGGVYDAMTVLSLGALLAEGQLPSEVWRLGAYAFLHFGPVHLITNVLVIAIVGPIVARIYGQLGFLLVTFVGIVVAGIFISYFGEPGITVGASGGTMSLVAAMTAYVLGDRDVRRSRWGRFVGGCLVILLVLEVIADLLVPEISFAGHGGGFIGGLLTAIIWQRYRK